MTTSGTAHRPVLPLNTATGKIIGHLSAQHRAVDLRDFLDEIDRQTEPGLAIRVICDNLSAHKAPVVHKWLLVRLPDNKEFCINLDVAKTSEQEALAGRQATASRLQELLSASPKQTSADGGQP